MKELEATVFHLTTIVQNLQVVSSLWSVFQGQSWFSGTYPW